MKTITKVAALLSVALFHSACGIAEPSDVDQNVSTQNGGSGERNRKPTDADIQDTLELGGAAYAIVISTPGQRGFYSLAGTRGQNLGIGITQVSGLAGRLSLLGPDGSVLASVDIAGADGQLDPMPLPSDGQYTVMLDAGNTTGTARLWGSEDTESSIVIDGSQVVATASRPGQNHRLHFRGAPGQYLGIGAAQVDGAFGRISVMDPDNAVMTSAFFTNTGGQVDPGALPVAGDYTIKVDPGTSTGSVALYLSSDQEGVLTNGGSVSPVIERPGQNCRYTFAATQGQMLDILASPVHGLFANLNLLMPDGTVLTSAPIKADDRHLFVPALPASGTYAIQIDAGYSSGDLTLRLTLN